MAYGQIRQIDTEQRTAVIALEDGREIALSFPPSANIEVLEPTTLGTMGGTLGDLKVGYWVDASIPTPAESACSCSSLVCFS
jgi:hypothetical protein